MATLQTALPIALTTAGRLGFYIDYSELNMNGTHSFFVCRTHGTVGSVSCTLTTTGDTHTQVIDTLTWADGEADIKRVDVPVTSGELSSHSTAGLGEHRIVATLSAPTGGAILHRKDYTQAYGVIDNDTMIANDSNAIFVDFDAGTNGDGSELSPFNTWEDARSGLTTERFVYMKGTLTVPAIYSVTILGAGAGFYLQSPNSRTSETDRLYIRNWPGFTCTIQGTGTNRGGFLSSGENEDTRSFHTYRGIDFQNLDNSSELTGFAIFYTYGTGDGSKSINVELCTASNINGAFGSNHAAFMVWGGEGTNYWRNSVDTVLQDGVFIPNTNTACFMTFDSTEESLQRNSMRNAQYGFYHKRIEGTADNSISARFNIDFTQDGIAYRASGSSGIVHSNTIVQGNAFLPVAAISGSMGIHHLVGNPAINTRGKHWWFGNVFHGRGSGEVAAIHAQQAHSAQIVNNIFLDCRKVSAEVGPSPAQGVPYLIGDYGDDWEVLDYNMEFGTTLPSQKYEYNNINHSSAAAIFSAEGYAQNDAQADPLFVNSSINDYHLDVGSPALSTGIGNTDRGIYLTGEEIVGPNGLQNSVSNTLPPSFTNNSNFVTQENQSLDITLAATGQPTITYSIVGGNDASEFSILNDVLTFSAQDFESPSDTNTDNIYEVSVRATNGLGTDDLNITTTVSNVLETVITDGGNSSLTYANGSGGLPITDPQVQNYINSFVGHTSYTVSPNDTTLIETNSPYTFTFSANDAQDVARVLTVTEDVAGTAPTILTTSFGVVNENQSSVGFVLSSGDTPITFSLATGVVDNDLLSIDANTGAITKASGNFDFEDKSSWSVSVTATNANGSDTQTINFTITDIDEVAPVIVLNGDSVVNHIQNTPYVDAGATASDNVDGNLGAVAASGSLDVNTIGSYVLTYSGIVDAAGNAALPVIRTVNVVPDTPASNSGNGVPKKSNLQRQFVRNILQ